MGDRILAQTKTSRLKFPQRHFGARNRAIRLDQHQRAPALAREDGRLGAPWCSWLKLSHPPAAVWQKNRLGTPTVGRTHRNNLKSTKQPKCVLTACLSPFFMSHHASYVQFIVFLSFAKS
jgi:hypothetical protein